MHGSRGGRTGGGVLKGIRTPPVKSQKIKFLSKTGPDPLKNHKNTKPAFNVGSSSVRQRNVIQMAFRWRAVDGPLIVVFDPPSYHQLKEKIVKVGPSLAKFSGSAHVIRASVEEIFCNYSTCKKRRLRRVCV